jgi:hypothetical protein
MSAAIVFHPLALDSFLGPNTIEGPLAFAFILEGLNFFKRDKIKSGLGCMLVGSLCNIVYFLLPLYFFILYRKKIKDFSYAGLSYFFLISIYLNKHFLFVHHKPYVFLTYFLQNFFAPLTLNIFSFSLFNFSWIASAFVLLIFLFFFLRIKVKSEIYFYLPLILLPCFGVYFHPWNQTYEFWHEIIFSPSSYYSIIFGMTALLAFSVSKKFFVGWSFFILVISFLWGTQWQETSGLIEVSLNNLPPNFVEIVRAKRFLAWEFIFEHKNERGEAILQGLAKENPRNIEIQSDLKLLALKK